MSLCFIYSKVRNSDGVQRNHIAVFAQWMVCFDRKKHLDFHAKCVHRKIYAFMLLEKISYWHSLYCLYGLLSICTAKGAASLKSIYCKFIDSLIAEKYFENKILNWATRISSSNLRLLLLNQCLSSLSLFVLNLIFRERNEAVLVWCTYIASSGVEAFF